MAGVRDPECLMYCGRMSIQEREIETARGRMTWLEAGAGWPVVLLHAFPLSADMWRPQLDRVADGWRFIAPDLRGFGRLPLPSGGSEMTMGDYAADVLSLLDALEIDAAPIGGLSMGGYVTFSMFRKQPDRFTGMILADTRSQADTPQAREMRMQLRELVRTGGARALAKQSLPKLLSETAAQDAVDWTRALIESAPAEAIDAALVAMIGRPDSTPGLPHIHCSTLVVVGDRDEITPVADSEAMQLAIPRATLCRIPGAAHLSAIEQPDAFSRALGDFLIAHP
jgi:3-oxoadipate enol-lactonase